MTPAEIPPILLEALAVHEAFRRLGFTPDEIFIRPAPPRVYMLVRRSGMEFAVDAGENTVPMHEFGAAWTQAAEWWNAHPPEGEAVWNSSRVRANVVGLITALVDSGFALRGAAT